MHSEDVNPYPITRDKEWWSEPFIKDLFIPDLPPPPSQFDSQEDLIVLGKTVFLAFDISISEDTLMTVKKYKNCVFFNAEKNHNILWYFDGRFYFGEWQINMMNEG